MDIKQPPHTGANERFDAIFEALPPLDSPEYLKHLETATTARLPAQVLARAFRQLCAAGVEPVASATLARLLSKDNQYGYLKVVRRLAKKQTPRGQNSQDGDDLFQSAVMRILEVLPTQRGAMAEKAWVLFCHNCFEDAWRTMFGRRGERLKVQFVEPSLDQEPDKIVDLLENTYGVDAPWHVGAKQSDLPWLETVIERTIANIADPLIRSIAEDQFGPDPSPISSGRSASGKPPLVEQLGVDRYRISRALRDAKSRLAGALLADKEHEIDKEWLRKFVRKDKERE